MTARLEIFYFDAGGGHRNALNCLRDVLAVRHPEWEIVPVDLQMLLEPVDPVHRMTARFAHPLHRMLDPVMANLTFAPVQSQSLYNSALRSGATYGFGAILPVLKMFIRRNSPQIEELLCKRWSALPLTKPDLVISVIPNFNGTIFRALESAWPAVPFVTIMTDLADCPPRFWMENQDQVVICGTETAFRQALKTGFYEPRKVFRVSGMLLRREFYEAPERAKSLSLQDLGLSQGRITVLVMFGGNGSAVSRQIVARLRLCRFKIQTIVMCGKNRDLFERLQGEANCHPVGYVANVGAYMQLADIFVGKPGPGSISEAIQLGCPVIVERNARTMPQERPNVQWIKETGVGVAVKNFGKDVVAAVEQVIEKLADYKTNIRRNVPANRAVFEVAEILDRVLAENSAASTVARAQKNNTLHGAETGVRRRARVSLGPALGEPQGH